jgi:NAD(P)-dependent dehydrogenase (short-subunit alcohol dehydrogenase family)
MERTAATRDGGRADAGGGGGGDGGATRSPGGAAFVINVSAMEGKFYRYKTPNHPHTNMAKAALNMMTATSAAEYAERGVYMNAVDTGWINDENPLETAARIAEVHGFQTPIDEEDAAARCVAPALEGFAAMSLLGEDAPTPPFGKFFKDYRETEW